MMRYIILDEMDMTKLKDGAEVKVTLHNGDKLTLMTESGFEARYDKDPRRLRDEQEHERSKI